MPAVSLELSKTPPSGGWCSTEHLMIIPQLRSQVNSCLSGSQGLASIHQAKSWDLTSSALLLACPRMMPMHDATTMPTMLDRKIGVERSNHYANFLNLPLEPHSHGISRRGQNRC